MNKVLITLLFLFSIVSATAQDNSNNGNRPVNTSERFPVFAECNSKQFKELENCFYNQVQTYITSNFNVPEELVSSNFKGNIKVLFEVDSNGIFKVIHVDANDEKLILETKRVFGKMPKIQPATYNGNATYSRFTYIIAIPLVNNVVSDKVSLAKAKSKSSSSIIELGLTILNIDCILSI